MPACQNVAIQFGEHRQSTEFRAQKYLRLARESHHGLIGRHEKCVPGIYVAEPLTEFKLSCVRIEDRSGGFYREQVRESGSCGRERSGHVDLPDGYLVVHSGGDQER